MTSAFIKPFSTDSKMKLLEVEDSKSDGQTKTYVVKFENVENINAV